MDTKSNMLLSCLNTLCSAHQWIRFLFIVHCCVIRRFRSKRASCVTTFKFNYYNATTQCTTLAAVLNVTYRGQNQLAG